jgi:hypothetical protein
MYQYQLSNYTSSKDYLVIQNWLDFFERQIENIGRLLVSYHEKGVRPDQSLSKLEARLTKYSKKRDHCINRIAAKLPANGPFEKIILE